MKTLMMRYTTVMGMQHLPNGGRQAYINFHSVSFGNSIMTQVLLSPNNAGKTTRYTWEAKIFIALILVGCAASIYALAQVMMEGL